MIDQGAGPEVEAEARRPIHSVYGDGTIVYEGKQPPRIAGPDPAAQGAPHTVLQWDPIHGRVYKGREFATGNRPVRDVDFTNPTYPNGVVRPGHVGPPHQHRWIPVDPANDAAGQRR